MIESGQPIITLALVLGAGLLGGWLAKRASLPSMTGQILVGVLLGPSLVGLVEPEALHELRPMTQFALGLIAVAVGNHLNLKLLRRKLKRLLLLVVFEALLTPILVFGAMRLGGVTDPGLGWLLGTMAVATAPATVVAVVAESRARGSFVRTLIAGVALNNMACILLFEIARSFAHLERDPESAGWSMIVEPVTHLVEPVLLGGAVAALAVLLTRRVARSDLLASASLVAILFATGLSELLDISPLLSCLFVGVGLANITPDRDELGHHVFRDFETAIFAVFFTLAGMELDFGSLTTVGWLAALFVAARFLGKYVAAASAMRLSGAPATTQRFLGLALIPQAGVAIGLVFVVQEDPVLADVSQMVLAVGVTAVTINEIIGPIVTRLAIQRSGEAGADAPGAIDFLRPEHIFHDVASTTLVDAVHELADRLVTLHEPDVSAEELSEAALRQLDGAMYAGHGLAIPHAAISDAADVVGVMAVSADGLEHPTSDGELVHCVLLLLTPAGDADRHMEIAAALGRAIGSDASLERALYQARDPREAFAVLHAFDDPDLNTMLTRLEAEG